MKNFRHLSRPKDRVDFRDLFLQFFTITLGKAAGDHEAGAVAVLLVFRHFQDRVDGFLLRAIDEGAGVDDEHVGVRGFGRQFVSRVAGDAQHHLAINEVLWASERKKTNLHVNL